MSRSKIYITISLVLLFSFRILCAFSQQVDLNAQLPPDSNLVIGKLGNGFTYYLLKEAGASKTVLNLIVRAGANQENENQIEAAHIIEHIALAKTKHFNDPLGYFTSRGLQRGIDFNGSTDSEYTAYLLQIPAWDDSLLNAGLLLHRDCAYDFDLSPASFDRERKIVLEELRRGASYFSDMRDEYVKYLSPVNGFPNRNATFRRTEIPRMRYKDIEMFFHKWYTPDNQMILVIGDIDVASVEKKIKNLFSDIPSKRLSEHEPAREAIFHPGRQVIYASHKETKNYELQIHFKQKYHSVVTFADLQYNVVEKVYDAAMANRFAKFNKVDSDRMFSTFNGRYSAFGPRFSDLMIGSIFGVKESDPSDRLKRMIGEIKDLEAYGFTENEILIAKKQISKDIAEALKSRELRVSANPYIDHFVFGEPALNTRYLLQASNKMLETLNSNSVNQIVKGWLKSPYQDIVLMAPESIKESLPSKEQVLSCLDSIKYNQFRRQDTILAVKRIIPELSLGKPKLSSVEHIDEIDLKRIRLSNGITILLKTLPAGQVDQVIMLGLCPGGASLFPDSLHTLMRFAPAAVMASGVNNVSGTELSHFLTDNDVMMYPYVSFHESGFSSEFPATSIDAVMQAIFGLMTAPKIDSTSFNNAVLSTEAGRLESNASIDPRKYFQEFIQQSVNIRYQPGKAQIKDENLEFSAALKMFKEVFTNTKGFTFVFVGNFEEDMLSSVVIKYLSAIPTSGLPLQPRLIPPNANYGIEKTVNRGEIATKGAVSIKVYGNYNNNYKTKIELELIRSILKSRLTNLLRMELAGTYDVQVNINDAYLECGFFGIAIGFECDPSRIDELANATLKVINKLKDNQYVAEPLEVAKSETINMAKQLISKPDFWVGYLRHQVVYGQPLDQMLRVSEIIDSINSNDIVQFAEKYIKDKNVNIFKLFPEINSNK